MGRGTTSALHGLDTHRGLRPGSGRPDRAGKIASASKIAGDTTVRKMWTPGAKTGAMSRRRGWGRGGNIGRNGWLSKDPVSLRAHLGGRWLTAEYRAGDLVIFTVQTVHASLDNRSNQIRLSTDTRYQLASEPVDERWIGPKPIGHGPEAKRGIPLLKTLTITKAPEMDERDFVDRKRATWEQLSAIVAKAGGTVVEVRAPQP